MFQENFGLEGSRSLSDLISMENITLIIKKRIMASMEKKETADPDPGSTCILPLTL